MKSETIKFPIAILDEPLYLVPDSAKLTISTNNANLNTLISGKNNGTLVIYTSRNGSSESPEAIESIDKIIKAIQLQPSETVVINFLSQSGILFHNLIEKFQPKFFISLGVMPENLGLHIEYYLYKSFKFNSLNLIICDDIVGMDLKKRTALWNQLQLMYQLK